MKIIRYKKVQRNLNFYTNHYGFHQPYQILIDGTFCFDALKNQFCIQDQLKKYFQTELKLLTTQCVILEMEQLGSKVFGAMKIVKQFGVHKCGHDKNAVSGSTCLLSMINKNKNRYIIATQDRELQEEIRKIPGVPLLYLHRKAPCLERPSEASRTNAASGMEKSFNVKETEDIVIKKLKETSGIADAVNESKKKKKKKKGPNPLSCKKKQKKPENKDGNIKKRSRNRIRIPKQLQALLQTQVKA